MGNLSFALRTRSTSGQILNINSEGNSLNVALDNGALVAEITFQAQLARIKIASKVNDGQWHNVTLNDRNVWFDDKSKRDIARALHMDSFLTKSNTVLIIGRKDASSPSFDVSLHLSDSAETDKHHQQKFSMFSSKHFFNLRIC